MLGECDVRYRGLGRSFVVVWLFREIYGVLRRRGRVCWCPPGVSECLAALRGVKGLVCLDVRWEVFSDGAVVLCCYGEVCGVVVDSCYRVCFVVAWLAVCGVVDEHCVGWWVCG